MCEHEDVTLFYMEAAAAIRVSCWPQRRIWSMGVAIPQLIRSERVAVWRSCPYAMTEWRDSDTLLFQEGEARSINVSSGGMLLLMSNTPDVQQVFEVYTPTAGKEATALALVTVRWTRQISMDSSQGLSLVGVEFLLNPIASQGELIDLV